MYKTLIVPLLGVFFLLLSGVGEAQAQRCLLYTSDAADE